MVPIDASTARRWRIERAPRRQIMELRTREKFILATQKNETDVIEKKSFKNK